MTPPPPAQSSCETDAKASAAQTQAHRLALSLVFRICYATPILGTLTRAFAQDINLIGYLLVILLKALVLALSARGLFALTLTALAMVPAMLKMIILFSRP